MAIKRILAFRNDRFGEFLLNIPAFRALKRLFPESELVLVVNPSTVEIARCIDCVNGVLTFENRRHKIFELVSFARLLKKRKVDLCVLLNPCKDFNIVSFLAGIPIRVGYDRKFGFLLNKRMADKKQLEEKHEIDYNLDLVGLVGAEGSKADLFFPLKENYADKFFEKFDSTNMVAIHPWTSDVVKQWPVERFFLIARRIVEELGMKIVFVGGREEAEKFKANNGGFFGNALNLTGKTNLPELAAVLKKSKLLVSCDSGPVHMASCVSTPVVAIFRNDLRGKGSRRWGPISANSVVVEKTDLNDISVDEVFEKIKKVISR